MNQNNSKDEAFSTLMDAHIKFSALMQEEQRQIKKELHQNIKANYVAHTGCGKARYVTELVKDYGSQAEVAKMLDVSPSRISQLINSEKNRRNGK